MLFILDTQDFKTSKKTLDYDSADQILIQARNEAHRFANNYRKTQMSKEWK